MNSDDIAPASWVWQFVAETGKWLAPLVCLIGLGICVCAFRRCRKCGYLVFAVYFALTAFWLLFAVPVWRALHADNPPDISEQTRQKIEEAQREATDKVLAEAGHPPMSARQRVYIPFGQISLVVGVWLLARREPPVSGKSSSSSFLSSSSL